ncbi:MAG: hypothetical protein C4316_01720 [Chloroflexota bacterium]
MTTAPGGCEVIRPELAALAANALEPAEAAPLRAHLEVCAACRAEYTAYLESLATLAEEVAAEPPPSVRRLVVAAARADAAASARWRERLLTLGLVAALVLAAFSLAQQFAIRQQVDRLQRWATDEYELWDFVLSPRLVIRPLRGTEAAPEAYGRLLLIPGRPRAALVVNHLPPLDGGRVYQVWLRRDGERISLDTFQTDESGRARLFFRLPPDFETYQEMGVTIEPAGGGAAPSGVRVLVGSLKESSD